MTWKGNGFTVHCITPLNISVILLLAQNHSLRHMEFQHFTRHKNFLKDVGLHRYLVTPIHGEVNRHS